METSLEKWNELQGIRAFLARSDGETPIDYEQNYPTGIDEVSAIRAWLAKVDCTTYSYSSIDFADGPYDEASRPEKDRPLKTRKARRVAKRTAPEEDLDAETIEDDIENGELFVTWSMISRRKDRSEPLPIGSAIRHMRKSAKLLDSLAEYIEENSDDEEAAIRLNGKGVLAVSSLDDLRSLFMGARMGRQYERLIQEYKDRIDNAFPGLSIEEIKKLPAKRLTRVVTIYIPDPKNRRKNRAITFRLKVGPLDVDKLLAANTEPEVAEESTTVGDHDGSSSDGEYYNTSQQGLEYTIDGNSELGVLVGDTPVSGVDGDDDSLASGVPEAYDGSTEEGEVTKPPKRSPFSRLPGRKMGLYRWHKLTKEDQENIEWLEEWEEWLLSNSFRSGFSELPELQKLEIVQEIHNSLENEWLTRSDAERLAVHAIIDRLFRVK